MTQKLFVTVVICLILGWSDIRIPTVDILNVDKDLQFGIQMARWLDPCCIKNMYTSGPLFRPLLDG